MNNIKHIIYLLSTIVFMGCGAKTTDEYINSCFINLAEKSIENIEISFSGEDYSIALLHPEEEKCLVLPLRSDAHFDINACIDSKDTKIKDIGYYWGSTNKVQTVKIFFENDSIEVSEMDNKLTNTRYKYITSATCK